jgi:hypothetical protein
MENSLEVSTETSKYIFESNEQNTRQNYYTKEDNISFKNVTKFEILKHHWQIKIACMKQSRVD